MATYREVLMEAEERLRAHVCAQERASQEAMDLLCFAARVSPTVVLVRLCDVIDEDVVVRLEDFVERRLNHEPLAYITGSTVFDGNDFVVSRDVLIPRDATQELVVFVDMLGRSVQEPRFIDVGTGSGCIAISLAKRFPSSKVFAIDIAENALLLAKKNAARFGVDNVFFVHGNLLLAAPPLTTETIIVANLPYLPDSGVSGLIPDIKDYEPYGALAGGNDGLVLYREMFVQIAEKGVMPMAVICEILSEQYSLFIIFVQDIFPRAVCDAIQNTNGEIIGVCVRWH
jgi:release factor glutamine methyltransferase